MRKSPTKKGIILGVVLVCAIVWVLLLNSGGFSSLRSSTLGNSFVCTKPNLEAGRLRYEEGLLNLARFTAERNQLNGIVSTGQQAITKNNAEMKKFQNQKKAAEDRVKNLTKYINTYCSETALSPTKFAVWRGGVNTAALTERKNTCAEKRNQLRSAQQDVQKADNGILTERAQNKNRTVAIKNAVSRIRTLTTQIQNINNYNAAYNACKWTISGEVTVSGEVFVRSISAPTSVAANTPFTVGVRVQNKLGNTAPNYTGTIYMWAINADYLCYLDDICKWDDVVYPTDSQTYTFVSGEAGVHSFTNWFTIKRAGTYRLYVNLATDEYWKEDFVNILVR